MLAVRTGHARTCPPGHIFETEIRNQLNERTSFDKRVNREINSCEVAGYMYRATERQHATVRAMWPRCDRPFVSDGRNSPDVERRPQCGPCERTTTARTTVLPQKNTVYEGGMKNINLVCACKQESKTIRIRIRKRVRFLCGRVHFRESIRCFKSDAHDLALIEADDLRCWSSSQALVRRNQMCPPPPHDLNWRKGRFLLAAAALPDRVLKEELALIDDRVSVKSFALIAPHLMSRGEVRSYLVIRMSHIQQSQHVKSSYLLVRRFC